MHELVNRSLVISFFISGFPLLVVAVTGLVISILQAATQIQDQTISIVPKMLSIVVVLFFFGHPMMGEVQDLFLEILRTLPSISHSTL